MPTVNSGTVLSFHDTEGIQRDISPLILTLDPYDVPLLQWMPKPQKAITGTKHEWLEDTLVPITSYVLDVGGIDNAVTAIPVPVGHEAYFRADDLIKIDDEVMLVTGVDTANSEIDVAARGYGSTNPAVHAQNAVITRIGNAKTEGADAGTPIVTDKTAGYNYTQIFEDTVKVSGTRKAILQYGVQDEYAYQMAKVVKARAIATEQAIIHGVRLEDTTNHRRTMGGLLEFLASNTTNANGAALTKGLLDDLTQEIWRAGGSPRTMVMNIDQKERLFSLYENQIRTTRDDKGIGGSIAYFENSLGRFEVLLDRWVPRDKILVIDRELVGFGPLSGRDWSHTYMGQKGDYVHGQVVFEGTLEVRGLDAHGIISNLAL